MSKQNWIEAYGGDTKVKKFQAGGPMGAPDAGMAPGPEAGAPAQGPDLEGMLMEYSQTRDPQLAVAICDMLVEMLAAQGAGGAPAGGPGGPEGAPMARNGAKMSAPIF